MLLAHTKHHVEKQVKCISIQLSSRASLHDNPGPAEPRYAAVANSADPDKLASEEAN